MQGGARAPPVEQRISVEQRTCGGGRGGEKIIIVWPPLAIVEVVGSDELVEGSSISLSAKSSFSRNMRRDSGGPP